jgi:hypothetical protein
VPLCRPSISIVSEPTLELEEELEEDAPDVCRDGDPSGDRTSPGL